MSEAWDYQIFWDETIKIIRAKKSDQEYNLWFSRMDYVRAEDSLIYISVPSSFYRDQVKQRYLTEIEKTLLELSGNKIKIEFEINKASKDSQAETESSSVSVKDKDGQNHEVRESLSSPVSDENGNAHASVSKRLPALRANNQQEKHYQLNPDYTFDNFVIGDNSSFAANAAMAIVKELGTAYNPFLIYGGVGLGKTHLIQSIGNAVYRNQPEKRITYVQMESFTNEFIESIREKKQHLFKAKYRNADLLLIDDIHFIQNKPETQEELFYTFNALYEGKKQMVFTCDRPVSELKDIIDRLRNRFERGLNVDLQPPSYETRFAIIKKKAAFWGIEIPDESLHIVCNNITTNVRDLEKALTKLRAYSELMGKEITPEITKAQLKDFFSAPNKKNITIDIIIREVASYFNLSSQDLKNKRRNQSVAFPRQIAMYIARSVTEYSTTEIGIEFGGRDHSTVMYGCQKISDMMKTDPTIEPIISELTRSIKSEGTRS